MKILRHLPDGLGEPTEVQKIYKKEDKTYIVQANEAGRMIYEYDTGELSELVASSNMLHEEEVQQQGESEGDGSLRGEATGRQVAESVPMPQLQEIPSDNFFPGQVAEMSCCNIPLGEDRVCPGCLEIC